MSELAVAAPAAATTDDARYMELALALGRRGLGNTWPNPAVGAVIVKDGVILARGWTQPGGRPHAEVEALRGAKKLAQGATLYVTLEPCSHQGKSPPCADAIIRAGITRVVSAMEDPNPEVAGQGHERLRAKGIAVEVGLGADEARRAHIGHITRMQKGRPHVLLKLAVSADGKAGLAGRKPVTMSGEAARQRVFQMRAMSDAILVGVGTVLVRQSAVHLPSAGDDRALAGARRARRATEVTVVDLGRRDGPRDADLGDHLGQAVRHRRGHSAAEGCEGVPRGGAQRPTRSRRRAQGARRTRHHPADGRGRPDGRGSFVAADLVDEAALVRADKSHRRAASMRSRGCRSRL